MDTVALLLVVLAAVCHATWNLAAKRSAHAGGVFLFWSTLLSSLAFAPWALWIMARAEFRWTWPMLAAAAGVVESLRPEPAALLVGLAGVAVALLVTAIAAPALAQSAAQTLALLVQFGCDTGQEDLAQRGALGEFGQEGGDQVLVLRREPAEGRVLVREPRQLRWRLAGGGRSAGGRERHRGVGGRCRVRVVRHGDAAQRARHHREADPHGASSP